MAEVTAFRNNALPYPIYGQPWAVVFPMLDADGDLVTGATTPDAEVSKNGDTFADCTNESTEIATNSGVYYLLLTAAEMTADIVTVIAKSATAGMKTTVLTLYPRKLVSIRAGTSASAGSATSTIVFDASASTVDDFYNGMVCVAVIDGTTEVRMITDYTGSTQTATVVPDWNTAPDNNDTFTIYRPDGVQIQQANASHWNSLATVALPPTNAEMVARTLTAASYATAANQATIAGYIDTEIGTIITHLTDIKGATWSSTDSLEAIRDRGDAAWVTATGFSTHSAADVWAVGTRVLTAGTNIVLAKGTGITGFNDLSAAQVNAEAYQALADYDGPTNTEMLSSFSTLSSHGDSTWSTATGFSTITTSDIWSAGTRTLTAGTNIALTKGTGLLGLNDISVNDILAAVYAGTKTFKDFMRKAAAVLFGKSDGFVQGSSGTGHFRDEADTKNVITVDYDADGNRDTITTDAT